MQRFLFLLLWLCSATAGAQPRLSYRLANDWAFSLEAHADEAVQPEFNDASWPRVRIPHDWSIALPASKHQGKDMGFFAGGLGWYRKTFAMPLLLPGQQVTLQFDGVYHQADVYLNGHHLGFHPYGYSSFYYNITPYLRPAGNNVLAVKVDHRHAPSSRWYSGSGIYRHVWLQIAPPVHVVPWGTYVTTPRVSAKEATLQVQTTVANALATTATGGVVQQLLDASGQVVASAESPLYLPPADTLVHTLSLAVSKPRWWDVDDPYLYRLRTIVQVQPSPPDTVYTTVGIRAIRFDTQQGFFLNGRNVKLKGVNLHQDFGSMGTAVADGSMYRRLSILKQYGANAVRCSHHTPSPAFLDYCDQLGLLVIDEAFDKWNMAKNYYASYFDQWWQADLDAMVRRDRNHPSIIMWSIGNETEAQNDASGKGVATARMLVNYLHHHDSTRPVTAAIAPANMRKRTYHTSGFMDALDVVGYNYQEPVMPSDKLDAPNRLMVVTEAFPYALSREAMKQTDPPNPWYSIARLPYVIGSFVWVGADYLGESAGWPSTGWPNGLFDICMFEKPRAAFHRAIWNPQPMVKLAVADEVHDPGKKPWWWPGLAAHWNWTAGSQAKTVIATSNTDSVQLWLNGQHLGTRQISQASNQTAQWQVPYAAGLLVAKGFTQGVAATTDTLRTTGQAVSLYATADTNQLVANGLDVAHIYITLLDAQGNKLPTDERQITITVDGPGRLLGLDNGNLRKAVFGGHTINLWQGQALATVQAGMQAGTLHVTISAAGLPDARIQLNIAAAYAVRNL